MMILLFNERVPKSGQLFIFKLAYGFTDAAPGRRPQVIMGAGAFNAGDKADIAFVIAGRSIKECGKVFGSDQSIARLVALPWQELRPGKRGEQSGADPVEAVRLVRFPQPKQEPDPPAQDRLAGSMIAAFQAYMYAFV